MPDQPRDPTISTRQALLVMRLAAIGRDLCMVGLGLLGFASLAVHEPPASLTAIGVTGPAVAMWASGFLVGAMLSIAGGLWPDGFGGRGDEMQAAGCGVVGVSFAVWAAAIIARPDTTVTSWMVFAVLVAGVFGQIYRIAVVAAGVPRLTRYLIGRQRPRPPQEPH